jgi:hypothetical protein
MARRNELLGASDSDVRLEHRARACMGRRGVTGQEGEALGARAAGSRRSSLANGHKHGQYQLHQGSPQKLGVDSCDTEGGEKADETAKRADLAA